MTTETILPGDLLVNDYPVQTQPATIASGQTLIRGAVMGRVTADDKYKLAAAAAGDGSENPQSVLAVDVDASGGDVEASVYVSGGFDAAKLNFGVGIDAAATEKAFRAASSPLFVKTLV
ncbi:MAG: head decoration protein [bacterium]|nr:head decoration protein [bacterium]